MTNDPNFTNLFEEFPELAEGDTVFEKEVLAHFGLVFSSYANLERGLQLYYTLSSVVDAAFSGKIKNADDWQSNFDLFEERAIKSTFGNLLKLTNNIKQLEPYLDELQALKRKRDYFAHHFFREENEKMHSIEAMLHLLSNMQRLRVKVEEMSATIDELQLNLMQKIYPNKDISSVIADESERLLSEFSRDPKFSPSWEG